ncbi:MAG: glycosyltransferase family 9 protein, partial [Endomicrobia bacterium]|nr:glycosyltransferase family 9 protein [Endomicrobiia bacterium]
SRGLGDVYKRQPLSIVKQKKQGFQIPLGRWLIEEIKELMFDYLNPHTINSEGLINYNYLQKIIKQHLNKTKNYSDLLFTILVWEMWREKFLKLLSLNLKRTVELKTKMKILLINLGGLGDMIMMMPIIKALYDKYPYSEYQLLTIPRSKDVAIKVGFFSKVFVLPIHYKMINLWKIKDFIEILIKLRREKFDVIINLREVNSLLGMLKIFLIKNFVKSNLLIGYGKKYYKKIFDFYCQAENFSSVNEVELTYKLLSSLGIKGKPDYIFYPLDGKSQNWAEKYIESKTISNSDILIGFCPGSFRPSRRWPLNYWKELAYKIVNNYSNAKIFVFGSRDEKKLSQEISSNISSVIETHNDIDDFNELSAVMNKMDIVITNDTGIMHLAAALKRRVICIFGPGDVTRYIPYVEKDNLFILREESILCKRPCYRYNCKNLECLRKITPQYVFEVIKNIIETDLMLWKKGV